MHPNQQSHLPVSAQFTKHCMRLHRETPAQADGNWKCTESTLSQAPAAAALPSLAWHADRPLQAQDRSVSSSLFVPHFTDRLSARKRNYKWHARATKEHGLCSRTDWTSNPRSATSQTCDLRQMTYPFCLLCKLGNQQHLSSVVVRTKQVNVSKMVW